MTAAGVCPACGQLCRADAPGGDEGAGVVLARHRRRVYNAAQTKRAREVCPGTGGVVERFEEPTR